MVVTLKRGPCYNTTTLFAKVHSFSIFSCNKQAGFYCSHLHLQFISQEISKTTAVAVHVPALIYVPPVQEQEKPLFLIKSEIGEIYNNLMEL